MNISDNIAHKIDTFISQCTNCGKCTDFCQLSLYNHQKPIDNLKSLIDKNFKDLDAFMNCNQCQRCENLCPFGLDYKSLLLEIRTDMYEKSQLLTPSTYIKTSALYHWRRSPKYNNYSKIIKTLDEHKANSVTIIFPGCSATSKKHAGFKKMITQMGQTEKVVVYKDCCQVPRQMIGDASTFSNALERIAGVFNHESVKNVVVFCPNCLNAFHNSQWINQNKITFFTEYLGKFKLCIPQELIGQRVRLHHPCPIKNPTIKSDVKAFCKAHLIDTIEHSTSLCCGSGGMTQTFHREGYINYQKHIFTLYKEPFILTYCFECQSSLKNPSNKTFHLLDFIQ